MNIKNKLSFLLQVPEKLKHWICEFCFRRSRHLVYLTPACGKTVVKGRNQTILPGLRLTTTLQPDLINVPASPNPYFQHPAHQCMCTSSFIGPSSIYAHNTICNTRNTSSFIGPSPIYTHPSKTKLLLQDLIVSNAIEAGREIAGCCYGFSREFCLRWKNPDPLLWKC